MMEQPVATAVGGGVLLMFVVVLGGAVVFGIDAVGSISSYAIPSFVLGVIMVLIAMLANLSRN